MHRFFLQTFIVMAWIGLLSLPVQAGVIVVKDFSSAQVDVGGDGTTDFEVVIDVLSDLDQINLINNPNSKRFSVLHSVLDPGTSLIGAAQVFRSTDSANTSGQSYLNLNLNVFNVFGLLLDDNIAPNLDNGFRLGSDNFVGVSFVDSLINGGSEVRGFLQLNIVANDNFQISRVIYDDMGNDISLQSAVAAINSGGTNLVPEPSALAIWSLLGIGVMVRRNRRSHR